MPAPGALFDVGGHQAAPHVHGAGQPNRHSRNRTRCDFERVGTRATRGRQLRRARARTIAPESAGAEAGPEPRDARQISSELHTLLQEAGEAGPYVLVGHSNGGLYSRMYASMHPTDVAGLVLIEATPSDLLVRLPATRADFAGLPQQAATAEWMARFGLARLFLAPRARADLDAFPIAVATRSSPTRRPVATGERLAREVGMMETSMLEVQQTGSLGAMPLIVLSTPEGAPSPEAARIKQDMEDEMAALSTNSEQQVVEGASHMGFATRPEHAAITIRAINRVVDAVRSGQPLSQVAPR